MNPNLPRRQFLQRISVAAATVAAGATSAAELATYRGRIIDTHTHFYDPTRPQGVPWPPKDDRLLYRRVLPADYQSLPKPQPVSGTVVVEASVWVEDNQWILDLAKHEPFIVGFVGNLAPGTEQFPAHVKRFAQNRLFRGIRVDGNRLRDGLSAEGFLNDLQRISGQRLTLDVVGGPEMLPVVTRVAQRLPDLKIIIDHIAGARVDGAAPDAAWSEGMRRVAAHPNVYCKVSGLVEGTGHTDGKAPRSVEFYRPVLDVIWKAFGADRLVYGSNWPVSERFAPCGSIQQIVSDYFMSQGPRAAEAVFWSNSKSFYGWTERS